MVKPPPGLGLGLGLPFSLKANSGGFSSTPPVGLPGLGNLLFALTFPAEPPLTRCLLLGPPGLLAQAFALAPAVDAKGSHDDGGSVAQLQPSSNPYHHHQHQQ